MRRAPLDHPLRRPIVLARAILAVVALLATTAPTAAQMNSASIIGQVKDESGGILPGVTVTAKSSALQVPSVSDVTDANGEYRLTPLPIGTYEVSYELSGFQTVRHDELRLTIGFTAKQDVTMKVGALQETVTVSGQTPVVDVTSTSAGTQFTRESLDILPSSRNGFSSLMAQAPGARAAWDVGGGAATEQPIFRAFGQGAEPWPLVEGIITGQMGTNGNGNYSDYSSFEEAQVSSIGNDAEMPTRGIQISAVVKSGSNDLHGSVWGGQFPTSWQSENLDDSIQVTTTVNSGSPLVKRYDSGADLGGKIIANKLWWYGAVRRRHDIRTELSGVKDDGTPAEYNQTQWGHTQKVSYQMTPANRLIFFHYYQSKFDVSEASELRAWEAKSNKPTWTQAGKVEWQGLKGNALIMSLQTAYWWYRTFYFGNDTGPYATSKVPGPAYTDQFTGYTGGEFQNTGRRASERSFHTKGSLSWYKPDAYGNHNIKTGFDYLDTLNSAAYKTRSSGNYQLVFNNGAPFQIRTWNIPTFPHDVVHYLGIYVKDSWTIARRLTLNLGMRYAHNPGFIPASCRPAVEFAPASCHDEINFNTWNPITPNVHAAFDVTGDGKTVIKGGWARFAHMRVPTGEVATADPDIRVQTTYRWTDPNGNRAYDPGEVNLDVNTGTDFVSRSGGSNTIPNPDEREPMQDEMSVSLERQLAKNFGVRATGVYSRAMNQYRTLNTFRPPSVYTIPVTRPDPGPDGLVGNSDDPGRTFTYYEYPVALRGAAFERFMFTNTDEISTFSSFELAGFKRLSDRWQFMASYSATKRNIPFINGLDPGEQGSTTVLAPATPNDEINAADRTWEYTGKVSGAYILPHAVTVAGNYELRSGEPWARQVLFTGGATIPSITLRVEPIGTRRLPNRHLTNMRISKTLAMGPARKLDLRLNIYNLLNANTVMQVTKRSGPSFLKPTPDSAFPAIMEPRIFELSVAYRF